MELMLTEKELNALEVGLVHSIYIEETIYNKFQNNKILKDSMSCYKDELDNQVEDLKMLRSNLLILIQQMHKNGKSNIMMKC